MVSASNEYHILRHSEHKHYAIIWFCIRAGACAIKILDTSVWIYSGAWLIHESNKVYFYRKRIHSQFIFIMIYVYEKCIWCKHQVASSWLFCKYTDRHTHTHCAPYGIGCQPLTHSCVEHTDRYILAGICSNYKIILIFSPFHLSHFFMHIMYTHNSKYAQPDRVSEHRYTAHTEGVPCNGSFTSHCSIHTHMHTNTKCKEKPFSNMLIPLTTMFHSSNRITWLSLLLFDGRSSCPLSVCSQYRSNWAYYYCSYVRMSSSLAWKRYMPITDSWYKFLLLYTCCIRKVILSVFPCPLLYNMHNEDKLLLLEVISKFILLLWILFSDTPTNRKIFPSNVRREIRLYVRY